MPGRPVSSYIKQMFHSVHWAPTPTSMFQKKDSDVWVGVWWILFFQLKFQDHQELGDALTYIIQ